uniref:Uncharacterized protein n=1 Tax=Anguilla anguilla TaxID=7936 RepID=A0A0E9Y0Q2_ANGAN
MFKNMQPQTNLFS